MRKIAVTGLAALAAVLGSWGAVSVASAGTSPAPAAATVASAPSRSAGLAASPLTRIASGTRPGALAVPHSLAYPAGVTPAATAPFDVLQDVSCLSQGNCIAVGANVAANGGHGSPRSYHWTGSTWAPVSVPLPSSTTGGSLYSVSCKGTSCVAVGVYYRGSTQYLLAEIWNGTSWTVSLPTFITGSKYPYLSIVSCASATYCVAGGAYAPASNVNDSVAIAEVWNGSSWRLSKPPAAGSFGYSAFFTVSCPSTTFCLLGGEYASSVRSPQGGGYFTTLVDRFDGTNWTRLTDAALTPQGGYATFLDSISCTSATACAAVGEQSKISGALSWHGFAETFSGTGWTRAVLGLPASTTVLNAVSCATSTYCVAVGEAGPYNTGTTDKAIFEVMNGSTWKLHYANPPAGQGNVLVGVQCLASNYCVGAGTEGTYNTRAAHGLTWFWNGGSFTLIRTP